MTTVRDVVVAALRATGTNTGDGIGKQSSASFEAPYWVVYQLHSTFDGPATEPDADRSQRLQVTSVGLSQGQAEDMALQARAVVKGPLAEPSGWMYAGPVVHDDSRGVQRDDDSNPPLFWAVDWYRFDLTPE